MFRIGKCLSQNYVPIEPCKNLLALLAAIGVDQQGYRRILGVCEGHKKDKAAAQQKADQEIEKLTAMKLSAAAKLVEESINETLTYCAYPFEHWLKLRTNNPLERSPV